MKGNATLPPVTAFRMLLFFFFADPNVDCYQDHRSCSSFSKAVTSGRLDDAAVSCLPFRRRTWLWKNMAERT
jgi:hypothetical protein